MIKYKGWIIETSPHDYRFPVWFVHEEYDGPEDNRSGMAKSVEAAKEEIDSGLYDV